MIVQAQEQVGKGSEIPTNSHHTPTTTQPSTSKPQKKQSRRKQRKDTEDAQLSGKCVNLSQRFIALETTKTNQALEIDSLKRRVKKLVKKKGFGCSGGCVQTGEEITDLDANVEMSRKLRLKRYLVLLKLLLPVLQQLLLAQTLIEIKAAKPKAVTTAATTTTTVVTRPKARGVVVQEPSEFRTTTSSSQTSQLLQAKDKGKEKMVEPEKPLKKKDQILIDEEIAQRLQEELQAELKEEERPARQKEEDANIVEWDNVQAMIDADYELAVRLEAQEQEELVIEERSKMFVELIDKRKKHFARLRAEEQRRKPLTKA
ncbi:hypothetical protein Tco_1427297 [Tanacetum coccineum]